MIFQVLDDKRFCPAVYANGEIIRDKFPKELDKTWGYSSFLKEEDVEYARLYCNGKNLGEVCPEDMLPRWELASTKLRAYLTSFQEAKIDLSQHCFFDLVPPNFLLEFCEIKNDITKHVFQNFLRPKNYRFLLSLTKLVEDIKHQKLNLDISSLDGQMGNYRVRQIRKKLESSRYVSYNVFGTKTGRLTTTSDSFPILTLDKNFRKVLKPNNDWLVELDFNAAEIRTFLALAGKEQPGIDIHRWLGDNIFSGNPDRDTIKKNVFAWLYNPAAKNTDLDKIFNKRHVVSKYYQNGAIQNPFDRKIEADDHHSLNYLIQSTTSDILLRRMIDIADLLKDRKSYVSFSVHDSLVIDFANEDKDLLPSIVEKFSNTELGLFKANISAGKDFGNLRILDI